jgi:hypothetical protein
MYGTDAPVDLPLRPRSTAYVVAAALVLAFIAVCVSIFFSGMSATTLITRNAPAAPPTATQSPTPSTPAVQGTMSTPSDVPPPGGTLTVKTSDPRALTTPRSLHGARSESVQAR